MARPERRLPPDLDIAAYLRTLPPQLRASAVEMLGHVERDAVDRHWPYWAHDGQRAPPGCPDGADWRTWVIMAGRGFGKTLAGAHWITSAIASGDKLSIALVGATLDDARRVMVEGRSGLIEVAGAWISDWRPSLRRLRFRTGAEATLFSGASPDRLRGPEHHLAWCDELAKWEKPGETWDMLQLGLRLGTHPRALVTTTPRPGPVLRRIMAAPGCVVTGGPTRANPHLSAAWQDNVESLYAGTRLGRQELDGELLTDTPGALWTVELIERCRRPLPLPQAGEGWGEGLPSSSPDQSTTLVRTVIAVDPPSGPGTCGIIACARDVHGIAHILADHSVTNRSPEGWSRAVADAARIHSPNPPRNGEGDHPKGGGGAAGAAGGSTVPATLPLIVAEQNQGGKMVQSVLHTADPALRVKLVTATTGKSERAAPIAMLFEAGRVRLHGRFPDLEAELLGMIAGGDYQGPGLSPDRADAMVWALTELMLSKKGEPSIRLL